MTLADGEQSKQSDGRERQHGSGAEGSGPAGSNCRSNSSITAQPTTISAKPINAHV